MSSRPRRSAKPLPEQLVPPLLAWFRRYARDLPWRRTRNPYAIWVSEIMLQQTQVKTVEPYWQRWMKALPTLLSVATARPQTVHKLWEGLGYYSRVRNLQRAAQVIKRDHNGSFPDQYEDVLALPGIGRYTAGAICSIAYDQARPVLDGNVIRVLTRLGGIRDNPRGKVTNAKLWQMAQDLISQAGKFKSTAHPRPCSHLNQALMELGALVCTPRKPNCADCPLTRHCVARKMGRVSRIPNLAKRPRPTARRVAAFVVSRNGRYLVRQRPEGVVNAWMWEFPNIELGAEDTSLAMAARRLFGSPPANVEPLCVIRHSITRYRITLNAARLRLRGRPSQLPLGSRWVTREESTHLPFASAHNRILKHLTENASCPRTARAW